MVWALCHPRPAARLGNIWQRGRMLGHLFFISHMSLSSELLLFLINELPIFTASCCCRILHSMLGSSIASGYTYTVEQLLSMAWCL